MKKALNQFVLCFLLIIFCICFKTYTTVHKFNVKNVMNNISFLSSEDFKGRLTGSLENKQVEEYIKLEFINNNLKPFMGDYEQIFQIVYPHKIKKDPSLNITDNSQNIVKEFSYGKDYKEDMLNFKNNTFSFNNKNPLIVENNSSIQLKQNSDHFLFYTPNNSNLEFRSSFISTDPWSMCIMVSQQTLLDIKKYLSKGYNINCFIPFINKNTTAKNIMGYIEGKDKDSNPIIISSHFDHLGADLKDTVYKGALDNASGTAFMLEMMKYIKSLGTPEKNILFVGFNAEEFGCLGSDNFVKKYKNYIKNSKVFNFDMIGSDKGVPLCIMGGKNDSVKNDFISSISNTCSSKKIYFNYLFQDSSDHKPFRDNSIDAITFCDNDVSKIHTPKDTIEFISPSAIKRCYNVSSKEIIKYAFNNNPIVVYHQEGLIVSALGIILILITRLKGLGSRKC
ncbi:M28 family metallopeptidase [Clostridium brassicae]|nr:M28 family metallopeptidase [Clostridium brassicae]